MLEIEATPCDPGGGERPEAGVVRKSVSESAPGARIRTKLGAIDADACGDADVGAMKPSAVQVRYPQLRALNKQQCRWHRLSRESEPNSPASEQCSILDLKQKPRGAVRPPSHANLGICDEQRFGRRAPTSARQPTHPPRCPMSGPRFHVEDPHLGAEEERRLADADDRQLLCGRRPLAPGACGC